MIDRHRLERLGRHLIMVCIVAATPLAYTSIFLPLINYTAPIGVHYLYYAAGLLLVLLFTAPLLAYLLAPRFEQDWHSLSQRWRAWAMPASVVLVWLLQQFILDPTHVKTTMLMTIGVVYTPAAQLLLLLLHKLIQRFGFWAASGLGLFVLLWAAVI